MIWTPDFCPAGGTCRIEVLPDWSAVVSVALCPRHRALRDQFTLTDAQVLRALMVISKRKERARWVIKERLMALALMTKDDPAIPYTVDAIGNFILVSGRSGAIRTDLRTSVTAALAAEETVAGAPTITVN